MHIHLSNSLVCASWNFMKIIMHAVSVHQRPWRRSVSSGFSDDISCETFKWLRLSLWHFLSRMATWTWLQQVVVGLYGWCPVLQRSFAPLICRLSRHYRPSCFVSTGAWKCLSHSLCSLKVGWSSKKAKVISTAALPGRQRQKWNFGRRKTHGYCSEAIWCSRFQASFLL